VSTHDEAAAIASEHIAWCRRRRHSIARIMGDLGLKPVRTWDECFDQVAMAWLALACSSMPAKATTTRAYSSASKAKKRALSTVFMIPPVDRRATGLK
jgi:hypothetical protein